jgi:formylglycine-generating enzyme required for sulfatase activity
MDKLILFLASVAPPPTPPREDEPHPEGRIKVDAGIVHDAPDGWFKPGAGKAEWFKDHPHGPEMVVVPAGRFMMGSRESEYHGRSNEEPQHEVTFARPFAVGRFAVTLGEWDAGERSGRSEHIARSKDPKTYVSWDDAKAYVARLAKQTGKPYRLLSEAEWEYVARAGTTTAFWWGYSISKEQAQYLDPGVEKLLRGGWQFDRGPVTVNSFKPNPWGLYQVHGNVFEWTEDCWNETYSGAPADGSAWTTGDCNFHVVRGGSFDDDEDKLRSAYRRQLATVDAFKHVGFRVARTLLASNSGPRAVPRNKFLAWLASRGT